jgi:hypothetical protein
LLHCACSTRSSGSFDVSTIPSEILKNMKCRKLPRNIVRK